MNSGPEPGTPHIVVAGAGSIGCYTGGLLAAAGYRVTLLARQRIIHEISAHGLNLTDFSGSETRLEPARISLADLPDCLSLADLVLVTVKSGATAAIAELIATHAPPAAPVVSLQNGVANADTLRAALAGRDVRAAMVPFNVVPMGQGRFHRATSGNIRIGTGPGDLAALLSVPQMRIVETPDITAIQWGKLLVNLNNAINALSGLTLQDMMMDRNWRRLMADQMAEALRVLRAAGIAVKSTTPLPVSLSPHILRLPTPVYARIAARMLTIDPAARGSMSYDLMQNRTTEVDALQGAIIDLGRKHNVATPICARLTKLIHAAEVRGEGSPELSVDAVRNG